MTHGLVIADMVVPRLPIPKSNLDAVFDHDSPRTPNVQPYEVAPMSLPDLINSHKLEMKHRTFHYCYFLS